MVHAIQQLLVPAAARRVTLLINHILGAEEVATSRLKTHAGRSIRLHLEGWPSLLPALPELVFTVTPAGLLEWREDDLALPADLTLDVRPNAGHALCKLGLEPAVVELVELPEVGPVGQVHGVEPRNEFVGNIVSQRVEELSG